MPPIASTFHRLRGRQWPSAPPFISAFRRVTRGVFAAVAQLLEARKSSGVGLRTTFHPDIYQPGSPAHEAAFRRFRDFFEQGVKESLGDPTLVVIPDLGVATTEGDLARRVLTKALEDPALVEARLRTAFIHELHENPTQLAAILNGTLH